MFSALRRRIHLTPSTVIAILALLFAMSGGAYAAGKYLITSTKQIKPSVLKALAGKPGLAGPQGKEGGSGPKGAAGEPWTPNNALPSEATETGVWSFGPLTLEEGVMLLPLASFTVPLKEPLEDPAECGEPGHPACVVHILEEGVHIKPTTECPGSVEQPEAKPGNICVYVEQRSHAKLATLLTPEGGAIGAGPAGALAYVQLEGKEPEGHGTWAVTAE